MAAGTEELSVGDGEGGGTRSNAKVPAQGPLSPNRSAKVTILLPIASRRALAEAGTGKADVKLVATAADGEKARLSGRVKLRSAR